MRLKPKFPGWRCDPALDQNCPFWDFLPFILYWMEWQILLQMSLRRSHLKTRWVAHRNQLGKSCRKKWHHEVLTKLPVTGRDRKWVDICSCVASLLYTVISLSQQPAINCHTHHPMRERTSFYFNCTHQDKRSSSWTIQNSQVGPFQATIISISNAFCPLRVPAGKIWHKRLLKMHVCMYHMSQNTS